MIINKGYWNYYLSFRTSEGIKIGEDSSKMNALNVVASSSDGSLKEYEWVKKYLSQRHKRYSEEIENKYYHKWTKEEELIKYKSNYLPEYYYDFKKENGTFIDRLDKSIYYSKAEVVELVKAFYIVIQRPIGKDYMVLSLMPLKVYLNDNHFEYCPVYIYLLSNGYGIIKISVPIINKDSSFATSVPIKNWTYMTKIWGNYVKESQGSQYVIIDHKFPFTHAAQAIVKHVFNEYLLCDDYFSGFETFVLTEVNGIQLDSLKKSSLDIQKDLYHLANPKDFLIQDFSDKDWDNFWQKNHTNIGGIDFIKSEECRIIMAGQKTMQDFFNRKVINPNLYFEISMQRTYDSILTIALCQKDNEIYLYRSSQNDIDNVNKYIVEYDFNQNFFEDFLDSAPYNARKFYQLMNDIIQISFVDISKKIERLTYINSYKRIYLEERRTELSEYLAMLGTIVFGLPLINDTLTIFHSAIIRDYDLIPLLTTEQIAVAAWLFIIFKIGHLLVKRRRNI